MSSAATCATQTATSSRSARRREPPPRACRGSTGTDGSGPGCQYISGTPACLRVSGASSRPGRNEEARKQAAAGFDAWERLLAGALERIRQRGKLRAGADPAVLATGLLASIEGGMVLSQARQDMTSLRIAVEAGLARVRAWRS